MDNVFGGDGDGSPAVLDRSREGRHGGKQPPVAGDGIAASQFGQDVPAAHHHRVEDGDIERRLDIFNHVQDAPAAAKDIERLGISGDGAESGDDAVADFFGGEIIDGGVILDGLAHEQDVKAGIGKYR